MSRLTSAGIAIERLLDVAEERRADDAAAAPHERDAAVVEVPLVGLRRRAQQLIALRVADDLRGVERLAQIVDERATVARKAAALVPELLRRRDTLFLHR